MRKRLTSAGRATKAVALIASGIVLLGGCPKGDDIAGLSDSTFVNTMAALHAIEQNASLDSAGKSTARRAALQERGLTPDALERSARELARDPERAYRLWTAIDSAVQRLQGTLPAAAPRAPGTGAPPAAGTPAVGVPHLPAGGPPTPGTPAPGTPPRPNTP